MNRVKLALITIFLIALSMPAGVAQAAGTTIEVNNGTPITLNVAGSINATASNGIPVTVKGLPNLGAPNNGLAGFRFDFTWDKNVITLGTPRAAAAAGWDTILPGTPNNTAGTLTSTGFTTTYATDNVTLLYLGVTAVGAGGSSTSINVTITSLGDKDGVNIPATSVNATVQISLGTLQSIAVTPANPSIVRGQTKQFTATGNYSSGVTQNITGTATWTSSNTGVATVNSAG
ncbi:MAG: Ig-like domain-containing protein, partial [Chloroflexota bacterium]